MARVIFFLLSITLALSASVTHTDLNMTENDFHASLSMAGIAVGSFYSFVLWKLLP